METEIKIEVADLEPIRERLRRAGAEPVGVVVEDNRYFDRGDEIRRSGQSLRLRRDVPVPDGPIPAPGKTKVRLTWKGPLEYDDGIRSRPELEVAVSGFATTADILSQLGFRETRQLSKRRETWHLPDVEVALDTLAFGKFVELEGKERPIIHQTARLLGLDPNQGLEKSYLQLAEERATTGEKPPPG